MLWVAIGALAGLVALPAITYASTVQSGSVMMVEGPPSGLPAAENKQPEIRPMTDGEKAATGCGISTTAAMGTVYAIGPTEFVMLVVGGLIVPSSSSVLFVGLLGTVASMACGAGAAITPAVLWGWRQLGSQSSQNGAAAP